MVFIAGPRQVGKTTLAKDIAQGFSSYLYLSWDQRDDRKEIFSAKWPADPTVIVLDELHKYSKWKRWIKGEYDKHRERHRFIVTGSARMDIYRKGGDSLQGRYHHYRLHPFSLNELLNTVPPIKPLEKLTFSNNADQSLLNALLRFSGFPEPILAQNERTHRRWQKERLERFFREDVRDLENVRDLSSMQLLTDWLPEHAANILSLNSLREDLEVSHRAITHWMDILDRLYFSFRIRPFALRQKASLRKAAKLYLWDWSLLPSQSGRFENLIASHLLKFCHFLEDAEGFKVELFYLRDVEKREVDFLVTCDKKPWFAVEAKWAEEKPSNSLRYFGERFNIPFLYQVTFQAERDFVRENIHILPAAKFLTGLV